MSILATRMVEKPWGRDVLPAPFTAPPGQRIGEVWFQPPPEIPQLLIKYIFTSEKLSVQVHPGGKVGKEECWLVIAAQPGASLGVGFRQPISAQAMRAAALDGSIEDLLMWHPVQPGDFFYIPAGTVHAIGAGVSLIEVQQNADITFRLYDYGRPRELHLDAGLIAALGTVHDPALRRSAGEAGTADAGTVCLVDGPHFRLWRCDGVAAAARWCRIGCAAALVIPLDKPARIAGKSLVPGQCGMVLSGDEIEIDGFCLIAESCAP